MHAIEKFNTFLISKLQRHLKLLILDYHHSYEARAYEEGNHKSRVHKDGAYGQWIKVD